MHDRCFNDVIDFVIARNPDEASSLPFLVRLPLGRDGIALKVRETWPRTSKVYCHRADDWPDDLDVIERIPVRWCIRRGAAIDLVLDRAGSTAPSSCSRAPTVGR